MLIKIAKIQLIIKSIILIKFNDGICPTNKIPIINDDITYISADIVTLPK